MFKVRKAEDVTRAEAAQRIRRIADAIEAGVVTGGDGHKVTIPAKVRYIEDVDRREVELEIDW